MLVPCRARRPAAPQLAAVPLLWRRQWHSIQWTAGRLRAPIIHQLGGSHCLPGSPGLHVSAPQRRLHEYAKSATINFYRFRAPTYLVSEDELTAQAAAVEQLCSARGVLGTVILAAEGVNGSLAGELKTVREVVEHVSSMPLDQWADTAPALVRNEEVFAAPRQAPFGKLKVKVKPEIVTMRADKPLDMNSRGVEVSPEDWDDVIAADDVVVLDTRNAFESAIGTFSGAIVPPLSKFSEFPRWAEAELIPHRGSGCGQSHRRVAMFCTGGIRCEKASAYLLQHGGYKPGEVLQLKGGIQSYLTRNETASSAWMGHCFVFDERTAVDGTGESIPPAEAERLAQQLGPRAGKSLRKRLVVAAAAQAETNTPGTGKTRSGK